MAKAVLITGPARSGKTTHCLRICREAMKNHRPGSVIYAVPSAEAVEETERLLLSGDGARGLLGHIITDFVGLAFRTLKEAGCFPVRRIGALEKRYLIWRIIRETPLRFFRDVKDYEGFADVVGEFIAELKRGMIPPQDFLEACQAATGRGGVASERTTELHAMYSAFQQELKKRGIYDGDGLQWMAAEVLGANPPVLSSVETFIVDGFATYTPVELEILGLLARRVGETYITLCYEEGRPEVFGFVEETRKMLKKLCTSGEIVFGGDLRGSRELVHLERGLFGDAETQLPAAPTIFITPCADPHQEVETVAREIEKIRAEQGLDYGEFMVILRDVGEYFRLVCEVFGERRIPFSVGTSPPLAEEPFTRAVVSALELLHEAFQFGKVLGVLKNSYASTDGDVAAAIENYANEFGFNEEEQFRQSWTDTKRGTVDVSRLNEHKGRFLEAIDRLRADAGRVTSADEFRDFVFRVISELGLLRPRTTEGRSGETPRSTRRSEVGLSSSECRSFGPLASLLDTMCEYARTMGVRQGDYATFLEMLERGLQRMPAATAAPSLNSVRVTSIVGGAPRPAAVVFVCGLCEGWFPREIANEPFFKDHERRLIKRRGKTILAERSPLSLGERFFFYMAASRAAQRLILTFPPTDGKGDELARSHYLDEVTRLFSDLRDESEETTPGARVVHSLEDVTDEKQLRSFIAHHLSQKPSGEPDVLDESQALAAMAYNELVRLGAIRPGDMLHEQPATQRRLSDEVRGAWAQTEPYTTSVSELETFAECPFRHFCQYRLRLEEPRRFEFKQREEGILYHEVLAKLYKEIYGEGDGQPEQGRCGGRRGIESISGEELIRRVGFLVEEFINPHYSRLFRTPRMEVRRRAIKARLEQFLVKEIENEGTNSTRPTYFELSFGRGKSPDSADPHSTPKYLSLATENPPEVRISGRMDRVDLFEQTEGRFGVVLDYKRSDKTAKADLSRGTVLQPGIYMLALRDLFGIKPAGAFYYSISGGRKRGIFGAEEEHRVSGKGDVSRSDRSSYEEIGELMDLNARQAADYVRRILDGDISVNPADPKGCRTCPFSSVCRTSEQRHPPDGIAPISANDAQSTE